MGNHHSGSQTAHKPRKNVHWKSAGRPGPPGKPDVIPHAGDDEPGAVTLRWAGAAHDGGAALRGYQVECNRIGTPVWIRTAPPIVLRPELVLSGLEPPHRYQFRVAAINAVGISEYSELSDVLTVGPDRGSNHAPAFLQHLEDMTVLENETTEFRVTFEGTPPPTVAWFKDGYEIFSSRRTAITTDDSSSVLVLHQTLASDEGEIKCTATNRAGHAVTRARLSLEAAPKLRYPRQYEDGLLYEINETVFLKTAIVGKPTPTIEWRHDGQPVTQDERVVITNTPKFSVLKILSARRSDRGEYQVHASNSIGEDTAAFLVTVTAPPEPPRRVSVTRQVDKSVTLAWEPPADDGGCRIGNYVLEYYRTGWNVWLKATTSRKTTATLFDLIEGSEYKFRVKAESPYGMSAPSAESAAVKIPGRAADMDFLAVESRIITDVLLKEDGEEAPPVSPAPRRRRLPPAAAAAAAAEVAPPPQDSAGKDEFMLVLYPEEKAPVADDEEKRRSFQLELEDVLSPPPISFSAPELSSLGAPPFRPLRCSVSSTELLHERAMDRFYRAVQMKEQHDAKQKHERKPTNDIPRHADEKAEEVVVVDKTSLFKAPEIIIKSDSGDQIKRQASHDSEPSDNTFNKWQNTSFEEDYTASTVTTDEEFSDDGSYEDRSYPHDEDTYNPRDKAVRPSPVREAPEEDEDSERTPVKPLPLLDPNFIPKPILKRRESDPKPEPEKPKVEEKPEKPKKEPKMSMFKKITKMPVQKMGFPKILNKKDPKPVRETPEVSPKTAPAVEETEDKISDEGRTVIDYYSNIVKEYGGQKKPAPTLYLKTEDLKSAAEEQQKQQQQKIQEKKVKQTTKAKKSSADKQNHVEAKSKPNSVAKPKLKPADKPKPERKILGPSKLQEKAERRENNIDKCTQILLKTAERATIVIPIDYQELEEKAKENVRSLIDYMVDVCLLLLAFWVYLFKDERLAIPFLILIIYRQLHETLCMDLPHWVRRHTPAWITKKIS